MLKMDEYYELVEKLSKTKDVDLILEYANSRDSAIVRQICQNPLTPTDVLLNIFKNHDELTGRDATSHINFPLNIAEDIVFRSLSVWIKLETIKHPLFDEPRLLKVIERTAIDNDNDSLLLLNGLVENPNFNGKLLNTLCKIRKDAGFNDYSEWYGLSIILDETNDLTVLQAAIDNEIMLDAVTNNKSTSALMLESIVNSHLNNDYAMLNVSRHKNANTEILEKISHSDYVWARTKVALHKNSSLDTLKYLANDSQASVRKNVAKNKNTPESVLKTLMNDKSKPVRENSIKNLNS